MYQLSEHETGTIKQQLFYIFARSIMVAVAQLVRASDCGSEGRGFETHQPPGNPDAFGRDFYFNLLL